MRFACESVDLTFFENAAWRFENVVELDQSPEQVFAVLEDGETWPRWFKGITRVTYTSTEPRGVGTTRTVQLTSLTVYETFISWEPGRRFAFHFQAASLPLFQRFAEDYRLEALPGARTRFTYVVALDPGLALLLAAPIAKGNFRTMFREGALGLQRFCATTVTASTG